MGDPSLETIGPWNRERDGQPAAPAGVATSEGAGAGSGPTEAERGEPVVFTWRGKSSDLIVLSLLNFALMVLTVGIYYFWGKAEVRRRIWASVRINDEPLVYTGTGRELFYGMLIVIGLFFLPVALAMFGLQIYLGPNSPWVILATVVLYIVIFFLIGVAVYRARRYRLSRTMFRGIRGTMEGSALTYGLSQFWSTLAMPFTMGWLVPWQTNYLNRILTNEMVFGDKRFTYTGKAGPLYPRFTVLWIGVIVLYFVAIAAFAGMAAFLAQGDPERMEKTFEAPDGIAIGAFIAIGLFIYLCYAILSALYNAKVFRYFAEQTTFMGAKLRLDVHALGLVWIVVSNFLLVVFSLTILRPVAQARLMRYFVERFSVEGPIDFSSIVQNKRVLDRTGEGLAEAFDIDPF